MKCEEVVQAIPLYLYGEVSPATEEGIEEHVAGCQACAREFKLRKAVHSALDAQEVSVPAGLLQACRGDLSRRVSREPQTHGSWWRDFLHEGFNLRVPLGAMALIALGYFGARLSGPGAPGLRQAGLENAAFSSVRAIEPDGAGKIRISLDEIRRREITGRLDDDNIQRLLLAAVSQENSPGVRVESVGVLKECAQSSPVRAALLDAVAHDTDAGVRMKALEGLKAFAGDPAVRQTLAQVLLHDDNPRVRIEAIDVLSGQRDDTMVGILQDVFQKEDNHYVRKRVENALQEMHATLGTF
jgi:hypothetical protein